MARQRRRTIGFTDFLDHRQLINERWYLIIVENNDVYDPSNRRYYVGRYNENTSNFSDMQLLDGEHVENVSLPSHEAMTKYVELVANNSVSAIDEARPIANWLYGRDIDFLMDTIDIVGGSKSKFKPKSRAKRMQKKAFKQTRKRQYKKYQYNFSKKNEL